ncbi:NAD(P)/FAD-dependent oxidoreductase [Halocynthiibacter namhaensis]|uniref:NAD(P)/FAD-dependent oxidoreductase n=1 Tax=Halocynthiibacter namhaensis TaxID=1290553 RepID=UPI00057931FA|nr:FAD-binding oxidoreductase [Halocynthiibacter namhaensis]
MKQDILIIGGGVAGLSAAAHLAAHANVTMLEAESATGYHTSGRSAALFEEQYGQETTIALNKASRSFMDTHDGGFLSPRGFMLVGKEGQNAAFDADVEAMGLTELTKTQAQSIIPILNPDVITRYAHAHGASDIDTDRLMQSYTKMARADGAKFVMNAHVDKMSRVNGRWHVMAGEQAFTADVVINAAGAWASHIAQIAGAQGILIQPFRRSVARIPAPADLDVSAWPILFGPGETWYAKPDAGALIISPADEDPVDAHDAWADDITLAEGIARYQEVVTSEVTRVTSNWAGLRSFAPDRNLVLGFDGQAPGFFWCAGQGGYGMQSSPATGQLVADLIIGRPSKIDTDIIKRLSPTRFT